MEEEEKAKIIIIDSVYLLAISKRVIKWEHCYLAETEIQGFLFCLNILHFILIKMPGSCILRPELAPTVTAALGGVYA